MERESFENPAIARPDERALRQHQGRPRGAARHRPHLHERRADAHRPRRLADDRVPDPRRQALLRRHLLPARGSARHAGLSARAARASRRPTGTKPDDVQRTVEQLMERPGSSSSRRSRAAACPAPKPSLDARRAAGARLRRRSTAASARRRSFPTPAVLRVSSCAPAAARAAPLHRDGALHRCAAWRGRHLRSARRRLPSLLRRRALAGAALREDALRQRPARAAVSRGLSGDAATRSSPTSRARRSTTSLREMRDPDGGFYSTQDADSEGEEGKFFVWDERRGRTQLLGDDVGELACRYWDVTDGGNFEAQQHPARHARARAARQALPPRRRRRSRASLAEARATLFAAREQRIRPGLDDKDPHRLERPDDQRLRQGRRGVRRRRATARVALDARRLHRARAAARRPRCSAPGRTASPS